jgi:hypothetical protein
MKNNLLSLAVVALATIFSTSSYAAIISSTFDTDADGWTGIPGEGSVAYSATGGNPGGHIRVTDIGSGGVLGSGAVAPSKFLGNLSAFDAGTLSVDLSIISGRGGGTFSTFGRVWIQGGGTGAFLDLIVVAPPIGGPWVSLSATLSAANVSVTDAVWASILADVTEIQFGTDAFDGDDTTGMDNFSISTAQINVPEPSALAIFGLGLAGLGFMRRRRKLN